LSSEDYDCLAVFPLQSVVFFPGTLLPLHIFEPRYLAMTADCIATGSPMAVGIFDDALPAMLGVGRIVRHEDLPEDRYNIALGGLGRVVLKEELPEKSGYRRFRCAPVSYPEARDPTSIQEGLLSIRACLGPLYTAWPEATEALTQILEDDQDPSLLADRAGALILNDPRERQDFLETLSLEDRIERLVQRLAELVSTARDPEDLES
jgi:Lon protease-like protein